MPIQNPLRLNTVLRIGPRVRPRTRTFDCCLQRNWRWPMVRVHAPPNSQRVTKPIDARCSTASGGLARGSVQSATMGNPAVPSPFVAVVAFVVQAIAVEKRWAISNPLAISGASTAGTTTCRPVRVGTGERTGSTRRAVLKMSLYVSAPSPAT